MRDADLEDSWVVEGLAWGMHLGWLTVIAWSGLYFGVAPLVNVRSRFDDPTLGTLAAVATGVAFLAVSKVVFDRIRKGFTAPPAPTSTEAEPRAEPSPPSRSPKSTKKKRKKNKRWR